MRLIRIGRLCSGLLVVLADGILDCMYARSIRSRQIIDWEFLVFGVDS